MLGILWLYAQCVEMRRKTQLALLDLWREQEQRENDRAGADFTAYRADHRVKANRVCSGRERLTC